jgi:hypothetical protein
VAYLILDGKDVPVSEHVRVVYDWGGYCYIEVNDNQLWQRLYFTNSRPGSFADGDLCFPAEWNFFRYPLPDDLEVRGVLDLSGTSLSELPRRLKCRGLKLNSLIRAVPRDTVVEGATERPTERPNADAAILRPAKSMK